MSTAHANLLMVILGVLSVATTIVYVVLTWKNLKAFQRSVNREREVKHLDDIKEHVVSPIMDWIKEVHSTLSGAGMYTAVRVQQVDPTSLTSPLQIDAMLIPQHGFHEQLYDDALRCHFPSEFSKYDSFRNVLQKLSNDLTEFGRKCCESLWANATLPRLKSSDRTIPFVSFEEIFQAWLRYAVAGVEPTYYLQDTIGAATKVVRIQGASNPVACDSEENIKSWLPTTFELMTERWKFEKLGVRVTRTRNDAEALRETMLGIRFAQHLSGSCKYLGF